jgi:hypothetical protein
MSVPDARGFLLLRRAGGLWGIANATVEGLAAEDGGYKVTAGGEALFADEILGVVTDLRVHPPAPVLRRFWSEARSKAITGLAVYGRVPVVMVDPRQPPEILRF